MLSNTLKSKLQAGQTCHGIWLVMGSVAEARLAADLPFDHFVVDMEHAPIPIDTAAAMMIALRAGGRVPLVRVPWNDGVYCKQALDQGAWGVIIPMIMSPEEAAQAVAWCRHEPLGRRSTGGHLHARSFETTQADYFAQANDEVFVCLQIEHIEAVEQVEQILAVPGIDAAFVGPADLLKSMDLTPGVSNDSPDFRAALSRVLRACQQAGVVPGINCGSAALARQRASEGWRFLQVANSAQLMLEAGNALAQGLDE